MEIPEFSLESLKNNDELFKSIILIDVREEHEWEDLAPAIGRNFPLSSLAPEEVLSELAIQDRDTTPLYIICRSGARSLRAAKMFQDAGCKKVFNVGGGMIRWQDLGLPLR